MANFLKKRGAWDNKPTTVSSYVGADAAKPAEKKAKPKLDAKVLNSYVGKKVAEATVKMRQPGYNPPKQEHISSPEDAPNGEMTAPIIGAGDKKSLGKIKEAAATPPPFDKPYKKTTGIVTDKSGAKHGPMSKARDLARKGMQQMLQINPKIAESWSDQTLDELNKSTLASYVKKATGGLEGAANQAYEAGRRGTEGGKNFATAVKRVKGVEKAVNKLSKEAVNYPGLGTDVVDKKKKLNPQPALTMKAKQVKDFKEENIAELKASTLQSYADKAHQQALDATYDAAHLNRTGEEKLKADAKKLASKRAGGVQRAQTKLDKMSEEMTDQAPQQLAHGIGDVVMCTRTQRLASVISAEDEKYTVVYADGSTESGPADYWSAIRPVTEGRVIEQPRGWNVKHLKPAGHGIVGKKVRSYDFPGMHDSHYIEGHVTDEDPNSYHIRTTKVVRHHKEEPIANHHMHIRAPKGISLFGGAQGVYYAPKEMKPAAKKTMRGIRGKK